jgi:hypothetical protein
MMNVKEIMDGYFAATSSAEKSEIETKLMNDFEKLSSEEKELVRIMFLDDFDDRAKKSLEKIDISVKMLQMSQYVSRSYIADRFFGKSRQWLNNRLKGNLVNGKPVSFTRDEIKKLSAALVQISDEIRTTALQIAS